MLRGECPKYPENNFVFRPCSIVNSPSYLNNKLVLAIQSLLSHLKTLFLFSAFSFDIFPSSHHVTCFYYCPTFSPIASHNFRRPSPSCPDVFYAKLLIDLFFFSRFFFFGGTCFDTHSLTHPLSSPHDNRIPNDVSLPFISMIKYAYDIMHRSGSAVKAGTYTKNVHTFLVCHKRSGGHRFVPTTN